MSNQPEKSPTPKLPEADKKTAPKLSPDAVTRSESKASQLFRSFLRWAGLALVVFGMGALAAIFLFYVPKSNELKQAEQELATANATLNELHGEIASLEAQIAELSALEATKQALETELDQAYLHLHLVAALKDIRAAQYALAQENPNDAKTELAETANTLTTMQEFLEAEDVETINTLLSRLELALGGIDTNPFAAQSDLEVLAVGLMDLEETWFTGP
ncbi:MAG: hypothetical protein Fur0022_21010 [Anaerolineales bacterium]